MRLPVERFAGRPRAALLGLILVPFLAACGSRAQLAAALPSAHANGPAADYPVVVGSPYKVGDQLYTPVDTMNYDEVGYVAADGGTGITASHHTLPLPSYAEVTSLKTGHTILVRVERRGPMDDNQLIALSPAALAQLGASVGDPVRVRRVNPLEAERAALRAGHAAPPRMDTPASLVAVLKQKLPAEGSADLVRKKPAAQPALAAADVPPSSARLAPTVIAAPKPAALPSKVQKVVTASVAPALPPLPSNDSRAAIPVPAAAAHDNHARAATATLASRSEPWSEHQPASAANGAYLVQAATMSTLERAKKVAGSIDGSVTKSGQYFRVRTGPFATRDEAEASLAKVRAAGYSDARIFTNG